MDTPLSILLGAGASAESGVPSASDCVWDWKREIFVSRNPAMAEPRSNTKAESVRAAVQKWLDSQREYPALGSAGEYPYYAEKTLPIEDDRGKYFQRLSSGKSPSSGYHIIATLSELGWIKSVRTTNFDGLMVKRAHACNLSPIEITRDSSDRVYRGDTDRELLCVALHGDYKYGFLKNTARELDSQNGTFAAALSHEIAKGNLIVIGYSGRDKSLMGAIGKAYLSKGGGRLYWRVYGQKAGDDAARLTDAVNASGRGAYYIPAGGFDNTLYSVARPCLADNKTVMADIESLRQKLGFAAGGGITPFGAVTAAVNKAAVTNAYPVTFPKTRCQLRPELPDGEKPWKYCEFLMNKEIMAVPYKGFYYAWGAPDRIREVCGGKLKSGLALTPLTRELIERNGCFQEPPRKTLAAVIGQSASLPYSGEKVWDISRPFGKNIGGRMITACQGVRVSLFLDGRYTYLALSPDFAYEKEFTLSPSERKQFADYFHAGINSGRPNKNAGNYTAARAGGLFGKNIKADYPAEADTGFRFAASKNSALLGVNNVRAYNAHPPVKLDPKRVAPRR
jgi:hypothetical protein